MHGLPQQEAGQELLRLGGGLVPLRGRGEERSGASCVSAPSHTCTGLCPYRHKAPAAGASGQARGRAGALQQNEEVQRDEFPACTQQPAQQEPQGGRKDELRLHGAVRQQLCPRRGLLTSTPQQLSTGYRAQADEKQKPELTAGGFGTKVCWALWAAGRSHCTVTRELPAPCCAFSEVPQLSTRPGKVRRRPRGAAGKCCQRPEASPRAQRLRLEGQRSHGQCCEHSQRHGWVVGGHGESLHLMQDSWLLCRNIQQQGTTPFLEDTTRQTGPEPPPPPQEPGCHPCARHCELPLPSVRQSPVM